MRGSAETIDTKTDMMKIIEKMTGIVKIQTKREITALAMVTETEKMCLKIEGKEVEARNEYTSQTGESLPHLEMSAGGMIDVMSDENKNLNPLTIGGRHLKNKGKVENILNHLIIAREYKNIQNLLTGIDRIKNDQLHQRIVDVLENSHAHLDVDQNHFNEIEIGLLLLKFIRNPDKAGHVRLAASKKPPCRDHVMRTLIEDNIIVIILVVETLLHLESMNQGQKIRKAEDRSAQREAQ